MIKKTRKFDRVYLLSARYSTYDLLCTSDKELLQGLYNHKKYGLSYFPDVYSPETAYGKTKLKKITKKDLKSILSRNKSQISKKGADYVKRMLS